MDNGVYCNLHRSWRCDPDCGADYVGAQPPAKPLSEKPKVYSFELHGRLIEVDEMLERMKDKPMLCFQLGWLIGHAIGGCKCECQKDKING